MCDFEAKPMTSVQKAREQERRLYQKFQASRIPRSKGQADSREVQNARWDWQDAVRYLRTAEKAEAAQRNVCPGNMDEVLAEVMR